MLGLRSISCGFGKPFKISTLSKLNPRLSSSGYQCANYYHRQSQPATRSVGVPSLPPQPFKKLSLSFLGTDAKRLQPSVNNKEYILPSLIKDTSASILDPLAKSSIELPPVFVNKLEIFVPSNASVKKVVEDPLMPQNSSGGVIIEKHAKNVLKYRRRHMNRHKLKKLRKKMKFVYMKLSLRKKKRREIMLQKMQDDIIINAQQWDAQEAAQEILDRARKGGFKIDIFADRGGSEQKHQN